MHCREVFCCNLNIFAKISPIEFFFKNLSLTFVAYFVFLEHPGNLFEISFQFLETASTCVIGWSRNPPCPGRVHLILKLSHFSSLVTSSDFTYSMKKDKKKRYLSIMQKSVKNWHTLLISLWFPIRKWDKWCRHWRKLQNYLIMMYYVLLCYVVHYGNTGCGVFKGGIQNQKGFLAKN